jgi:hypothetical protein
LLTFNHNVDIVVIEYGGNIFTRKYIRRVTQKQTGFADSAIADNNTLDVLHGASWKLTKPFTILLFNLRKTVFSQFSEKLDADWIAFLVRRQNFTLQIIELRLISFDLT